MAGRMCLGALIAVLAAVTDVNSFFLPAPLVPFPIVPFVRPFLFTKTVRERTPPNSRLFRKDVDLPPVEQPTTTLVNGNANNVFSLTNGLDFGGQDLVLANTNDQNTIQFVSVVDPVQSTALNGGGIQQVNTGSANPIVYTDPGQLGTDVQVISDYGNGQNAFTNDLNGVQGISDYGQNGFANDLNGVQVISDYATAGTGSPVAGQPVGQTVW